MLRDVSVSVLAQASVTKMVGILHWWLILLCFLVVAIDVVRVVPTAYSASVFSSPSPGKNRLAS
jgi:TRAP-type mannitol/chloroaromatic compound transport system permease small subunit